MNELHAINNKVQTVNVSAISLMKIHAPVIGSACTG